MKCWDQYIFSFKIQKYVLFCSCDVERSVAFYFAFCLLWDELLEMAFQKIRTQVHIYRVYIRVYLDVYVLYIVTYGVLNSAISWMPLSLFTWKSSALSGFLCGSSRTKATEIIKLFCNAYRVFPCMVEGRKKSSINRRVFLILLFFCVLGKADLCEEERVCNTCFSVEVNAQLVWWGKIRRVFLSMRCHTFPCF